MTAERRQDVIAVTFLLLLPLIFFGDVLLGINNFAARDLTRYYYPTKQIYRQIVAEGEFPFWNPYFHGGQPLAANPEHEIFYPFTWLLLLPNYDFGYRLHIFLHIPIALLAMYSLLRSMRIRAPAAFLGAISWGLGGLFLSYVNLLPILFCVTWMPFTALYTRRLLLSPNVRDFSLASLFLGLQCLVAEPTTLFQTGLILGSYALYRAWHDERRTAAAIRNIGWVAAVSAAAFIAGSVQLLAAWDHAGDSVRSRGFGFSLVETWSMPWAKLTELVFPNILGRIGLESFYWGTRLYEPQPTPFLYNIYPGFFATALAAAGFIVRPRGGRFVLILFAASVLVAAGGHTPLLRMLYDAGIATSIRYPEKFLLIAVFAMTIFAARLLDAVLAGDDRGRFATASFALSAALIAAGVSLFGLTPYANGVWLGTFGLPENEFTTRVAALAWTDWQVAALRGFLLFALLWWLPRASRPLWIAAATLFVCVDVGKIAQQINPRVPAEFFTAVPEAAGALPPRRDAYRIFHEADWDAGGEERGRYFSDPVASYYVVRNGLFPPAPAAYGIRSVLERDYDETALLPSRDLLDAMSLVKDAGIAGWWRPFMAMSNVWYRAAFRPFGAEYQRIQGDYTRVQPVDFLETGRFPRYYFADEIRPISGLDQFVETIVRGGVSERVAFIPQRQFQLLPGHGRVVSVEETPNSATINVVADETAFLVISITPHKYWHVTIDGRRVETLPTNIAYQGVVVPPGRHRIALRYRNRVIVAAFPISAAAFAVLGAAALLVRPRSERNRDL
jgi:hypothetical protein